VINLGGSETQVATQVAATCRDWGFFIVTRHGIPAAGIAEVMTETRRFFAQPLAAKRALVRTLDNPWGYFDRELTKNRLDRKEIFDIGPPGERDDAAPFEGETLWPGDSSFVSAMQRHIDACEALSSRLMALIVTGLGVDPASLDTAFRPSPTSFLRLNSYPAGPSSTHDRGVHHHSDAGALTVLLEDGTPGLQVLNNGLWHDVEPVAGALIINIGDMMQVWANDRYSAPIHRVMAMHG
jgi:isopenicillin N synthase-like dioxygenase